MATWTQLVEELAACEKARGEVKKKADRDVADAEKKVGLVKDKLQEANFAHEKQMREIRAQCEALIAESTAKKETDVGKAETEQAKADARRKTAEDSIRAAEQRAKLLEAQVRDLHACMDHTEADKVSRLDNCRRAADTTVQRKNAGASRRAKEMSNYAREVQTSTWSAIDGLQEDHKEALAATDKNASQRSRFNDLKNLSMAKDARDISQREHVDNREELFGTWHKEWVESTTPSATPTNRRLIRVGALVSAGSHLASNKLPPVVLNQAALSLEEGRITPLQ